MDTKRLISAIVISIAIFIGTQMFSKYMGWMPPEPVPVAQNATGSQSAGAPAPAASQAPGGSGIFDEAPVAATPAFVPAEGRLVTVETPMYRAVFHSNGGVLRQFFLKRYNNAVREDSGQVNLVSDAAAAQAPLGILIGRTPSWGGNAWALEGGDLALDADGSGVLRFTGEAAGLRLTREFSFDGSSYLIREKLRVSAAEPKAATLVFSFAATTLASEKAPGILASLRHWVFGGETPAPEESQYNMTRVAWLQDGKFKEEGSSGTLEKRVSVEAPLSWMAVMNNYFMGAVSMDGAESLGEASMTGGDIYNARMGKKVSVAPGDDATLECVYFLGPKDSKRLESAPNHLDKAIDYGFFSVIAKPLVWLLQFLYSYVHNWGVAIVLMTVLIKLLFWPLSQKSYKSMQQMKQLQPLMAKLREKYADDKETMNREIMQLYKTYKVNPAGGCLPILVQIPVFFGLYQALLNAIELRHAPFIPTLPFTDIPWLVDLSSRDPYLITPLIMGASMFLQQKLTPTAGDPTQARIMMFMPVIFTVLFLGFPSGLVAYWLVNNIISIGQQWWLLRRSS